MWRFFQCAVAGRGHERRGIPCQDKTYRFQYNGVNTVALADGAGSAKLSHLGASRISEFTCKEMAEHFDCYYANENGHEKNRRHHGRIERHGPPFCGNAAGVRNV